MVSKYKRKTNQAQWSEDTMKLAVAECNSGAPVKTTATKYGLPYATLYRHWKSGTSTAQLGRFRKVFNDAQETGLQEYLRMMDSVFYGLTRGDFKRLAFVYAKKNNLTYPPNWDKNEKAGDDWLVGFFSRNPLICPRVREATSVSKVKGSAGFRKITHQEAIVDKNTNQLESLYEEDDETTIDTEGPSTPEIETLARHKAILRKVIPAEASGSVIQGSSRDPSMSRLGEFEMPIDAVSSSTSRNKEDRLKNNIKEHDNDCATKNPESSTSLSANYFSPKEIRPLPTPCVPISTRKRNILKSEVLTSTPVKEEQKAQFIKTNTKVMKNINKNSDEESKSIKVTKTNSEYIKTEEGKGKGEDNNIKYTCYFCGEDYIEINGQPVDDWIQCRSDSQWNHEKCTTYEGRGTFLCHNCTSSY